VTACDYYETPLGNLAVDTAVEKELVSNPDVKFEYMSAQTDEEEHSLEMQMPYIYKILQQAGKEKDVKVVPIMVGAINCRKEKEFGKLMARYLENPENACVVSTDFCHWWVLRPAMGQRC
jgi:AmmeMemoRadiSam system protein B